MDATHEHVFEKAGLGIAPFTLVGMTENVIRHPDGTTQNGGCCKYCYNGIRYEYRVRDANGKTFVVGSDCAAKTGDAGLRRKVTEYERKLAAQKRAKAADKAKARITVAKERIATPEIVAQLSAKPHPNARFCAEGKTMLDYAQWVLANGGTKGRLEIAKLVGA